MFSQNGIPVAPSFRDRIGRLMVGVEQAVVTVTRLRQPEPVAAPVIVAAAPAVPVAPDPSDSIPEAGAETITDPNDTALVDASTDKGPAKSKASTSTPLE